MRGEEKSRGNGEGERGYGKTCDMKEKQRVLWGRRKGGAGGWAKEIGKEYQKKTKTKTRYV